MPNLDESVKEPSSSSSQEEPQESNGEQLAEIADRSDQQMSEEQVPTVHTVSKTHFDNDGEDWMEIEEAENVEIDFKRISSIDRTPDHAGATGNDAQMTTPDPVIVNPHVTPVDVDGPPKDAKVANFDLLFKQPEVEAEVKSLKVNHCG
jgi:hypothetical protein